MGASDFHARMRGYYEGGGYSDGVNSGHAGGAGRPRRGLFGRLLAWPFRLAFAAVFGAAVVFGLRYARFLMWNDSILAGDAARSLTMDVTIALLLGLVAVLMIRSEMVTRMLGFTAGALIAVTCMHNVVWAEPDLFAILFSDAWVNQVKAETASGTAIAMTGAYPLSMDGWSQFSGELALADYMDLEWLRGLVGEAANSVLPEVGSAG